MFNGEIGVTEGSGNAFSDFGVAAPEEELAKAQLASHIRTAIRRRKLSQARAAALEYGCSMTGHAKGWRVQILLVLLCLATFHRAEAQHLPPGATFRDCPTCPEMVVIPPGTFQMGTSASDYQRDQAFRPPEGLINTLVLLAGGQGTRGFPEAEMPQHSVAIQYTFAMSRYPVTVVEFVAFVRDTGYSPKGDCLIFGSGKPHIGSNTSWRYNGFDQVDDDPVVCIRADDARAYIQWLNKKAGHGQNSPNPGLYRLPSEAEWEYAARAGTTTAWWWGDEVGDGNANCDGCKQARSPGQPTRVGTYPPNPFGLYDMLGNVSQLVSDCWNPNYNDAPNDGGPWLTGDCSKSIVRGGGYHSGPWFARAARRAWLDKNTTDNVEGFRVARQIP